MEIIKEPDYKVVKTPKVDAEGNAVKDQYGHIIYTVDYSQFPDMKRTCSCCGAQYKFKMPELLAAGDKGIIGINGWGLGFACPKCNMPICVVANTKYNVEDLPLDDPQS